MDSEILKLMNQKVIQTKRLANAAWEGVEELKIQTAEMKQQSVEIKALVMIIRNEMQLSTRPWWKKLFGLVS